MLVAPISCNNQLHSVVPAPCWAETTDPASLHRIEPDGQSGFRGFLRQESAYCSTIDSVLRAPLEEFAFGPMMPVLGLERVLRRGPVRLLTGRPS